MFLEVSLFDSMRPALSCFEFVASFNVNSGARLPCLRTRVFWSVEVKLNLPDTQAELSYLLAYKFCEREV